MELKDALSAAGLLSAISLCSSCAALPQGSPDKDAAIAAAIRTEFSEWLQEDERGQTVPLCLDSETPIDVEAIASELSATVIRPVPSKQCSSKTVEGDFGMFTALTTYFDPSGQEAAYLKIVRVGCVSTSSCVVDIDALGGGMSYKVQRTGNRWKVTSQDMRWVV